jgi:uncharacterized protein YeaO (DUF488 family)
MPISIVRLGSPRRKDEGPRLGTVRRPPRGVKKGDYARFGYYDLWLPDLSPSAKLVKTAQRGDWDVFVRQYRREMSEPAPERLLALLALLSHGADFSVGCYCEDESRCHRSILRQLLAEHGAKLRG